MRVHYDPQTFLRQRTGGISRHFVDLMTGLRSNPQFGVTFDLPLRISNNRYLAEKFADEGVRCTPDWLPRGFLYAPWYATGTRPARATELVHHTYYSRRFLARRGRTPSVVSIYDMIPELFEGTSHFTGSHLAKEDYARSCDLVVCISDATRNDLLNTYPRLSTPTVVIPLSVDPGFRPHLEKLRGLPSDYLLYVGGREGYKNFDLLPGALRQVANEGVKVPLVVVGKPLSREELVAFRENGLGDHVFHVSLGDDALKRAYSNATLVVQTSSYEGFGLTALEGLASGVPVVVANSSSMPEVCGDAARYFTPGDSLSLAEALAAVVSDSQARDDLKRKGLERAHDFTVTRLAERMAAAYRSVLR